MNLFDVIEEIEEAEGCAEEVDGCAHKAKAEAWAKEHPEAFALFERFALQLAERNRRFGMKQIAERVRWEVAASWEKDAEGFRINNSYTAWLGRMLVQKHPHLARYIEFRRAGDEEREVV
jgi:hypothetical protein